MHRIPCLFPIGGIPRQSVQPVEASIDGGELLGNLDPPSLGQYLRIAGSFSDKRKCDQSRLYFHFQSASRLFNLESLRLNMPLPRRLHQGMLLALDFVHRYVDFSLSRQHRE